MVAISGYDMTLTEDGTTTQMEESLNLFQVICVNKFFKASSQLLKNFWRYPSNVIFDTLKNTTQLLSR